MFSSAKKGAGKSRGRVGRASGRGRASYGGGKGSLETQFEAVADVEQQQQTVDEPEPEQLVLEQVATAPENDDPFNREDATDDPYHLGMLHGCDVSWSNEWSSATPMSAEPGSAGSGVKAQPGPRPPERARQTLGGDGAAKAKDAVHEVEWDGQ
eukprot:378510-Amphidinium_carterae.1